MLETLRRERFTRAALRQANIWEKKKVRRLVKYKSKFLISEVPTLWNLRTGLQKRLQDKSDVPAEMRWNLPRNFIYDLKTFYSPSEEWILLAASTINPEEREFVVDSGASTHISKKDLNKAELEKVLRIGFIRKGNASWKYNGSSFTWKTLRRIWVQLPVDQWPETTSHQKWQEILFATHQTMYHSLSPTSSSSTSPTSSLQESVTDTEIPATRRSGSTDELAREDLCMNQKSKTQTKMTTTKNYRVMSCKVCQTGCRSSSVDWLMKVFQNIETLPVLLMNFWSRKSGTE